LKVFDEFSDKEFPSLREQLDQNFEDRYKAFWLEKKKGQKTFYSFGQPINPSEVRLNFDISICKALGIRITKDELINLYRVIVEEMIITRGLTRD
jgi:hypothetical protein